MADGFHHLAMRASDFPDDGDVAGVRIRADVAPGLRPPSNETVARTYLDRALRDHDDRGAFRALRAGDSPRAVPSLELVAEIPSPYGEKSILRFRQTFQQVPVYGARAMVELGPDQTLSHLDVDIADETELAEGGWTSPQLSPQDAEGTVWEHGGLLPSLAHPPLLTYFRSGEGDAPGRFVLCWRFRDVPRVTPDGDPDVGGWESARHRRSRADYFVDAMSGSLVAILSRSRSFTLPVDCTGEDEDGTKQGFGGSAIPAGFEMVDPVRHTTTHDFGLLAYDTGADPPPAIGAAVANPTTDWAATNPAAVTAHVSAQVVHDFFESVLHRQSVDGLQMTLESVVNCADVDGTVDFLQAYWTGGRMLYGQIAEHGTLVSIARHLDVVAHELSHGVTEHTANLRYQGQSGALNESMSDLFGVIVRNRGRDGTHQDAINWDWEIGRGLAPNGPLRSLRTPAWALRLSRSTWTTSW